MFHYNGRKSEKFYIIYIYIYTKRLPKIIQLVASFLNIEACDINDLDIPLHGVARLLDSTTAELTCKPGYEKNGLSRSSTCSKGLWKKFGEICLGMQVVFGLHTGFTRTFLRQFFLYYKFFE